MIYHIYDYQWKSMEEANNFLKKLKHIGYSDISFFRDDPYAYITETVMFAPSATDMRIRIDTSLKRLVYHEDSGLRFHPELFENVSCPTEEEILVYESLYGDAPLFLWDLMRLGGLNG